MRGKSPSIVTSAGGQVIADNWEKKKNVNSHSPLTGSSLYLKRSCVFSFSTKNRIKKSDITSEVTETRWGSRHHLLAVWHEAENLTFFES